MFSCEAGDGRGAPFGRCLCHTPAFARLNAESRREILGQRARVGRGRVRRRPRRIDRGEAPSAQRPSRLRQRPPVRRQVRRAALGPQGRGRGREDPGGRAGRDAGRRGCRRRRLRRTGADAGADRRALARDDGADPARGPDHGGRRLHQSRRRRRSRKNAAARLHQRPRHGGPDLRTEARDRRAALSGDRASGRPAR